MAITLHADPVPLRVDDSGAIRVGESRVTLDVLLQYWRLGMKPEEIARGLDTLALADVHGALAYYLPHQNEIDNYLRRRDKEAETMRQQIETANASRLAPWAAQYGRVVVGKANCSCQKNSACPLHSLVPCIPLSPAFPVPNTWTRTALAKIARSAKPFIR